MRSIGVMRRPGNGSRPDRTQAMDHMVVVMFENRSFDNLLGRLYQPARARYRWP